MNKHRGYSMIELLVVVAIVAIATLVANAAWRNYQRRASILGQARTVASTVQRARMLSITRGASHFVVFNPTDHTIKIFADSNSPVGVFDSGDPMVVQQRLAPNIRLGLPPTPSPLPSPVDGTTITDGWAMPVPDPTSFWGATRRGFAISPTGRIRSAEATPTVIENGAMIFKDTTETTVAVGVRGQFGIVKTYRLFNGNWKAL